MDTDNKPVYWRDNGCGFLLGLTGFKRLVEFLYPAQGYIGIIFILMIIVNFANEVRKNRDGKRKEENTVS